MKGAALNQIQTTTIPEESPLRVGGSEVSVASPGTGDAPDTDIEQTGDQHQRPDGSSSSEAAHGVGGRSLSEVVQVADITVPASSSSTVDPRVTTQSRSSDVLLGENPENRPDSPLLFFPESSGGEELGKKDNKKNVQGAAGAVAGKASGKAPAKAGVLGKAPPKIPWPPPPESQYQFDGTDNVR